MEQFSVKNWILDLEVAIAVSCLVHCFLIEIKLELTRKVVRFWCLYELASVSLTRCCISYLRQNFSAAWRSSETESRCFSID